MNPRLSTVDGVLTRSARRWPQRLALHFQDRSWTYAQLDDAVSRCAAMLLGQGLRKGDRVAAYGKNSDAYLIAFLGCARAGLVHVPVNFALTGTELTYLIEQSGASAVLVDPALEATLAAVDTGLPTLMLRDVPGSLVEQVATGQVATWEPGADDLDLAQLLYTSGTTSRPKGAMMTHRALLHEYVSCVIALDLKETDNPVHSMPLYHSAQMHVFALPYLMVGATSHLLETPDVPTILELVEQERIGSLFLAPTVWVPLSNHPDLNTRDLGSLKKAYYGASIMPVPVLRRLQERLPELGFYNCFGQSEVAPLCTVLRPEEHAQRPESCGRAVTFVDARVVDENGQEVAAGESGEIVYQSPQLCSGYWDKPEETAEAFRDGWFHSGDLARIDEQGYLTIVDRIKDVINTGGILVAPREIEDAIYTHPAVAEVAVIGTPDERWIEAVTAYVVIKEPVGEDELIAHARQSLAPFKVPKKVHLVEELPRNQSGKLLKRVLREQ